MVAVTSKNLLVAVLIIASVSDVFVDYLFPLTVS
jgi:hypothetical protein